MLVLCLLLLFVLPVGLPACSAPTAWRLLVGQPVRQMLLPPRGVVRVGVTPEQPPVLPRRETGLRQFTVGPNRFDDPYGEFVMRYGAATLRGCMVELLARFRPLAGAEVVLDAVSGVEDTDEQYNADRDPGGEDDSLPGRTPGRGEELAEWLPRQRLVVLRLPTGLAVADSLDGQLLHELDKHPLVADRLSRSPLTSGLYTQRLEPGLMGLAGPVGRPITNAASRALYEWRPDVVGWGYPSRLDPDETCWALYADRLRVSYDAPQPLDPIEPLHRAAVRDAASYLEIPLPHYWA